MNNDPSSMSHLAPSHIVMMKDGGKAREGERLTSIVSGDKAQSKRIYGNRPFRVEDLMAAGGKIVWWEQKRM